MLLPVTTRLMRDEDWPAVERIFRAGIDGGNATFESAPPSWEQFVGSKPAALRWVATDENDTAIAWAAASAVSTRPVYAGVAEHSIYVAPKAAGRGVGLTLLTAFIAASENTGIWTLQASLFPENTASLALHERAGFRRIGIRERVGLMSHGPFAGHWRDTILIERRSV
ncbi:GNAT family N-acetyltransferase [Leifsonia kafniensis]|uniref:GNAT family N-acetyltransferase n=1 Tax=Leifsonia kafniensis TaxID=475957 RepID=A0ABP7KK74_9MICO